MDPLLKAQVLGYRKVNNQIQFACLGVSTSVFLAWQYAFRDKRNVFAHHETWEWLDRRLPARAVLRTRDFMDNNFILRYGDQRVSPWTLITSAFSHRDMGHFIANTLAFNTWCQYLQYVVPPAHFIGLIFSTALAGSAGFLIHQSRQKFPNRRVRGLGMSGITSGLGLALAVAIPSLSIGVLGYPVPIWVALGGYAAWDAFFLNSEITGVGHSAHLGGAAAGLLYTVALQQTGTTIPLHKLLSRPRR